MRFHLASLLACTIAVVPTHVAADAPSGGGNTPPSMSSQDFDAAAEYRHGIDLLKAKNYADAKKSFAKVLGAAPTDASANFLAGLADAGLNDLKSAVKHYEKAVRANDKLIPAQQELGVAYVKTGDMQKAQATLAKLQKMDSDCKSTCKDAADLKAAIDAVQTAIGQPAHAELTTDPPLLFASAKAGDSAYLQAVSLINEHRYQDAIAALQRAKTSFGAHPDILTYLGFANRKLGRDDVAASYYRQALAVAPNHKGATEYYGELMVERGDMVGAKHMLAKLDAICTFGCAEAEDLRRWIAHKGEPAS
jgi:tetratricopeptide (TPR) repeat protein